MVIWYFTKPGDFPTIKGVPKSYQTWGGPGRVPPVPSLGVTAVHHGALRLRGTTSRLLECTVGEWLVTWWCERGGGSSNDLYYICTYLSKSIHIYIYIWILCTYIWLIFVQNIEYEGMVSIHMYLRFWTLLNWGFVQTIFLFISEWFSGEPCYFSGTIGTAQGLLVGANHPHFVSNPSLGKSVIHLAKS